MPPKGAPWEIFFSPRYTDGWMEWCVCVCGKEERAVSQYVCVDQGTRPCASQRENVPVPYSPPENKQMPEVKRPPAKVRTVEAGGVSSGTRRSATLCSWW